MGGADRNFDSGGEVRRALEEAVREYGSGVLSQPQTLNNFFKDQLGAESQREASLLVSAAGADVAGVLNQHLEGTSDLPTAANATAATFAEGRDLRPDAAAWAVDEFARALGHPVENIDGVAPGESDIQTVAPPPAPAQPAPQSAVPPPPPPGAPGSVTPQSGAPAPPPPGVPWSPPTPGDQRSTVPPQWPPAGPPGVGQPASPWAPGTPTPPVGDPVSPWTPGTGGPGAPGGGRSRRPWLIPVLIGAPLAVLVLYFVIAAIAGIAPFSSPTPTTTTTLPTAPPSTPPGPTPATGGVASLMPPGGTGCTANAQSFTGISGVTESRDCTDNTDLPGTNVRAYQFDNPSDYQTSFNAYKQVVGFTNLAQGCPPPSNNVNGTRAWFTPNYPQQSGQFVDCGLIQFGNNQNSPTYVWTIPSRQTFVRAVASPNTSFTDLNTWFNNHALP